MTPYEAVTWRKARRSGGGNGGNCVEVAAWTKSSRSGGGQGGACVEVTTEGSFVLIRDSKYLRDLASDPAAQPIIAITTGQWLTFLGVVSGRSAAATEPDVTVHPDGSATLRAADSTRLHYTPAEWEAFRLGVVDGEFDDLLLGQAPGIASQRPVANSQG